MNIDFNSLNASEAYFTMTQTIIPRPIAWVLTDSGNGTYNLAPFSYFNAICSNPPLVVMSVGKKLDGDLKDTRTNIVERKKLVIHIAQVSQAEQVTESARSLAFGESELDRLDMELVHEDGWSLPRLADTPVAMECEFYDLHELGPNNQAVFYCKINRLFVSDEAVSLDEKGRIVIDAAVINPLGRLGPNKYVSFGDVINLKTSVDR